MQSNNSTYNFETFSFWKSAIYLGLFFIITPVALISSIISLTSISAKKEVVEKPVKLTYESKSQVGVQVFASLPQEFPSVGGEVMAADARVEIIRQYLEANKSELEPYSRHLVESSDKYELDYRLLTAIAHKESGLCNAIPEDSYNCWGWGIHSKGTLYFDSYDEAITEVSRGLKENYKDLGYVTVPEIMQKWIPHSPEGAWAEDVLGYITSIE